MLNGIVWNITVSIKRDLALNTLQRLICHKTQTNKQANKQTNRNKKNRNERKTEIKIPPLLPIQQSQKAYNNNF